MKRTFTLLLFTVHLLFAQNTVYISTADAKADLIDMMERIDAIHYNPYLYTPKQQVDAFKDSAFLTFEPDSIPLKRMISVGMKLVGMMSGGHSAMDWQHEAVKPELRSYAFIPFTGKLSENGTVFTVTKSSIAQIPVGSTVSEINGIDMHTLYTECMAYFGGIPAYKNASCEQVLPLYLYYTEMLEGPYTIQSSAATEIIATPGLNSSEMIALLNSQRSSEDYTFTLLPHNVGLIAYNSCHNPKKFDKFLKQTFKTIDQQGVDKLIIDLRANAGGDSELNDQLLAYLTDTPYRQASGRYWKVSQQSKDTYSSNPIYERIFGSDFMKQYISTPNDSVIVALDGNLTQPVRPKHAFYGTSCFLIGPNTFSSANFLADAIKTYQLSTLIGLPTGENTNDFGEQISFTLPRSNCFVYVSSTYDIGANGDPNTFTPVMPDIATDLDALEVATQWILKQN